MTEAPTKADELASFAIYEAIAATLQYYIEGARTGDGALMRRAFLETAHIRGSYGGKPVDWTLSQFCELIDKNGPAAEIAARIVTIDHSGGAAMARLEAENWRGTRYTDFFVLLEIDTDWRIASKVFFAHSRA
jgi:Putative lumazine-binding